LHIYVFSCKQSNWKKRSRGFVQDWAEEEPDNDLTKNYPFPIPRIREIPDEFDSFINDDESNQTKAMPIPTDENNIVPQSHEVINPYVVTSNGSANVNKNFSQTLSPFTSDSLPANLPIQDRVFEPTQRRVHSQKESPHIHTKCKHCGSGLAQSKSYTDIKSTVRKPSNASESDVARARSIIRNSKFQE